MSRRKSATPKERVLARYPEAIVGFGNGNRCWIYDMPRWKTLKQTLLGSGVSCTHEGHAEAEELAWQDAAKRLRGKR